MPIKESKLTELEKEIGCADFWNEPMHAQQVSKAAAALREHIQDWRGFKQRIVDDLELAGLEDEILALRART